MSVFRNAYLEEEEFCRKDMLDDLQLAAELGKTLLERNKELETSLKHHQNVIEDQTQEIEYLTKQTVALREVNDSRLRIYEQLEVSIHDLERENHRLSLDNVSDKKQIKKLCDNVDALEAKCDELQSSIDELTLQLNTYRKKVQKHETKSTNATSRSRVSETECDGEGTEMSQDKQIQCDNTEASSMLSSPPLSLPFNLSYEADLADMENEQTMALLVQLREARSERATAHRRTEELEEQLAALVHDNQRLEDRLVALSTKDEMRSMHDEFNTLEEVRQGQLCVRCLRNMDSLSILDPEEDAEVDEDDVENASMMEALLTETRYHSSLSLEIQHQEPKQDINTGNCYRDLVDKYEKSLHRQQSNQKSLQEELSHANAKDTDEESGHFGDNFKNQRKIFTPTDFSEAETSSSGYSEDTSNKSTQTDGRPGSFLCTIADGTDCKFSIYDDASPIDSRFRNRPEYRLLFKEIFTVLKKAAENKDEGDQLPLLDDNVPGVPPVTPSTEHIPNDFPTEDYNDNQSVTSEASCMSELCDITLTNEDKPAVTTENGVVLTPYKREPLDYISVAVNVRKKSSKKSKKQLADRSESPISFSPKINYTATRRKREVGRPYGVDNNLVWNGLTMQFRPTNRSNVSSPTPSQNGGKSRDKSAWDFKPSPASEDLNKLKKLDLSYAEVLRNASKKHAKNVRKK